MSQQMKKIDTSGAEMRKLTKMSDDLRANRNIAITWCAGFISISLIILQDYISTGIADIPIFVSLSAFSVALPLLTGTIVFYHFENMNGYIFPHKKRFLRFSVITFATGAMCAYIGIAAAIWHLTWIAGTLFLAVTVATYFAIGANIPYRKEVQQAKREEAEKELALE